MLISEQIKSAIGAHGLWKSRLKSAIENGTSEFTVDRVAKDDQCDFGKFLYGADVPAAQKTADYEKCRALHASFHKAAAKVLRHALFGEKAEAIKEMAMGSEFARVSTELTTAMMSWSSHTK